MGLDQFAFSCKVVPDSPVDFILDEDVERTEVHYWRKHPNLQGWMQRLYKEKGGTDEDFNCVPVQLTTEDLDRLEMDIRENKLPPTGGFFFGESDGTEFEDDLKFIDKARQAIADGLTVYYSSWW